MPHDSLWAPWRLAYIKSDPPPVSTGEDCFLCRYLSQSNDDENLVLLRSEHSCVVLNRFPYNNGHLLVAPLAHQGELGALSSEQLLDLQQLLTKMIDHLRRTMNPDGFNVGLNLGRVAGAGLPGHVHWHIVPRWNGDTNFMPVISDTKVMPQSLQALFHLLKTSLASTD